MRSFTDLEAWNKGMDLVDVIYVLSKKFPKDERFGLTSQVRDAVVSIVANIAEGFSRYTFADKANRYVIARGECGEVQAFLFVAERLRYIDGETARSARQRAEEVGRILSGLIASCRRNQS